MTSHRPDWRLSYFVLCACLVLATVMFGVRVTYQPSVRYAIAFGASTAISLAAWKLGASAIRVELEDRRCLAVAGALLILPIASFAWLAGFATPQQATASENQIRYFVLLIDAIAVAGGLVVLRQALGGAGERFYSTLGVAAILLATSPYVLFTTISLCEFRALERVNPGKDVLGIGALDELSLLLLFFGVVLTYLAVAAFAAGLGRAQLLSRRASRVFVGANLIAVLCVGIKLARVLGSPNDAMWAFEPWYALPGQVLSIPAVPWFMPCMLGVALLRRAGDQHH